MEYEREHSIRKIIIPLTSKETYSQGKVDNSLYINRNCDFRMSKANTYIEVDATVRLKTMFLDLPIVTEYTGKSASYFTVKYKSAIGY